MPQSDIVQRLASHDDSVFTSLGLELELLADESGIQRAPKSIPILPNKKHVKTRDRREFMIEDPQALIDKVREDGIDLVVGRQHDEVWGADAAGWINHRTGLKRNGRYGIVADVEWTDLGRAYVESRSGRYISPVLEVPGMFEFLYDEGPVPTVTGITAASVVNIPALRMPSLNSRRFGATSMNEEIRKQLCAAFGLPLDAKPETILAAAEAKGAELEQLSGKLSKIEIEAEQIDLTQWVPREEFNALAKRLAKVEAAAASTQVDQALAKHRKKIQSPAYAKVLREQLSSGALTFEAFEALMEAAPESRLTVEDKETAAEDKERSTLGLEEHEIEFCKDKGIDPAKFAKTKADRIRRRTLRAI